MTVTLKDMFFRTMAMLVISVQVCWGSDPPKSYGPPPSNDNYYNYEPEIQRPLAVFTEKPINVANFVLIPVIQVPSSDLKLIYKPQVDSVSKTEPIVMCKSSSKSFEATPAILVPLQQPFYLNDERTVIPFPKTVTILHGGYRMSIPVGLVVAPIPVGVLPAGPVLVTTLYAIPASPVLVPSTIRFVPVKSYPAPSPPYHAHPSPPSSQYSYPSPPAHQHPAHEHSAHEHPENWYPSPPEHKHPSPPEHKHPSPSAYQYPSPPEHKHPSPPAYQYPSPPEHKHPSPPAYQYPSPPEHKHPSPPTYQYPSPPENKHPSPPAHQHSSPPSYSYSPPPKYSLPAPPEPTYYQYGGGNGGGGGEYGKLYSHYSADPPPFHNSKESPVLQQLREEAEKERQKYASTQTPSPPPPPPPSLPLYALQFQAIDAY